MSARTPRAAVIALRERFRRVASCITNQPLTSTGAHLPPRVNSLVFLPPREPVSLRLASGQGRLLLHIKHDFIIARDMDAGSGYTVQTQSYFYRILDSDEQELVVYHWHPVGESTVSYPHLHLSNRISPIPIGRNLDPLPLADLHVVSGIVEFAGVVRMLIEEFGIAPFRDDWQVVLDESIDARLTSP